MFSTIGIALGDVTGIGPEVTLKALAAEGPGKDCCYVLIGDAGHIEGLNRRLGLNLSLKNYTGEKEPGRIFVCDSGKKGLGEKLAAGAPEAARAAYEWVKEGAERCLRGELDGLVTAPVNKEAIVRAGIKFVGQTELLSELAGTERTAMMLLGQDDRGRWLRVALATTHVPLKLVSSQLSAKKIVSVIELTARACRDLGLERARVGVCGLNPHAGEGGQMGMEEIEVIGPAVKEAQALGIDAVGPLSADALFYYAYRGDYDAVVAMYHDQGLAPLKMVAFEQGVNWTLGLPFVRTSPDHGTAYDIAGKGVARESSMVAAMRLASRVRRKGV
jgi:4-hydroxythreonine-4-phosphate dehydrogenase